MILVIMFLGFITAVHTDNMRAILASVIAAFSFSLLDRIATNIKELNKP